MSLTCHGLCERFEGYTGNPKYDLGYRYCTTCGYSIICDAFLCPCCKTTLRRKPRHKTNSSLISQKGELAYV